MHPKSTAQHTSAELANFIGGTWRIGTGPVLTSIDPTRQRMIAAGAQGTPVEVDDAVTEAVSAFGPWSTTPMHDRGAILVRAAALLESRAVTLGRELTMEEGKTLAEAIGEVQRAAAILRYAGHEAERTAGELYQSPRRGERIAVTRRPIGVIGVVTPFNFPIAIPAWKLGPALVHGNTVVWKPASTVPLLAIRLAEALDEAGLPAGTLNVVLGNGQLGTYIVDHPGIDAVTFTGSTTVGRGLAARAAARGIPMQAEMGGKNAAVVLPDADIGLAAEHIVSGAYRSAGQKCTATSRLVAAEPIADELAERIAEHLSRWRTGDPLAPSVDMGPMITQSAAASVRHAVDDAVRCGAKLRYGCSVDDPESSAFAKPVLLEIPESEHSHRNRAWQDELFGPVLAMRRAPDRTTAFAMANDGQFGLSCALFTRDLDSTLTGLEALDVGILHVNSESAGADPHVPFGGAKKSGLGPKEQGPAAREFFTHTTTVYLCGVR